MLGAGRGTEGKRPAGPRRTSPLPSTPPSCFKSARSRLSPSSMPARGGVGQAPTGRRVSSRPATIVGVRRPAGLGPPPQALGLAYGSMGASQAVTATTRLATQRRARISLDRVREKAWSAFRDICEAWMGHGRPDGAEPEPPEAATTPNVRPGTHYCARAGSPPPACENAGLGTG